MNYEMSYNNQITGLDKIYLDYFGYKTDGIFVEVGAYDGINFSATWGLAHAGWKGLYYEPIPEYFEQCKINHKNHNVTVLNTCIGDFVGTVSMHVCNTLSTTDDVQFKSEYWKKEYSSCPTIICPITTLDISLKEQQIPTSFDVLLVDVEGAEEKVLKKFDIQYWQPKMCIIEVHEQMQDKDLSIQAPAVNEYFSKAGYKKIYSDIVNNIYTI